MFDGLRTEQDIWKNCINMIISLLEDSLFNDLNPTSKNDAQRLDWLKDDYEITVSSPPSTPSFKRKRSTSETAHERKMQKLSSNLANDIARGLSMEDDDDDDESSDQEMISWNKLNRGDNPMPTLRRISLSGNTGSSHSLEQWMRGQAELNHMSYSKYKQVSDERQKLLRKELELLQASNQTFEQLRDHLHKVLRLADELSGDHTLNFMQIFPEWSVYENRVNKLATFVQSMEDMNSSIHATIPRTSDLLEDIKGLQNILDTKLALYGDALTQNGLEWKAMGLPVDDRLLDATKQWLYNLCIGLMEALDSECKKIGNRVTDMSELYELPVVGEELMTSILIGLEFISEASMCIGYTCLKIIYSCRTMVTIYGQWMCENLSRLHDKEDEDEKRMVPSKRVDIRYMQLLDNMTQTISCLLVLSDLQIISNGDFTPQELSIENLSAVLVEFTIRAIGVIETEKNQKRVTGNIMTNPQTTFVYMTELLLTFVDRVIELGGTDVNYNRRMQTLHTHLEDIENSLKSS